MRVTSTATRAVFSALLALLLGLRLLGATGYMPAFDRGSLTIIVCPDADANAPLAVGVAHHHHGPSKHQHGVCPYASASSLGALGADVGALLALLSFASVLLIGSCTDFFALRRARERPPLRGPPLPA